MKSFYRLVPSSDLCLLWRSCITVLTINNFVSEPSEEGESAEFRQNYVSRSPAWETARLFHQWAVKRTKWLARGILGTIDCFLLLIFFYPRNEGVQLTLSLSNRIPIKVHPKGKYSGHAESWLVGLPYLCLGSMPHPAPQPS